MIIITETKLGESAHFSSEFMPPGYSPPIRKDRQSSGGGVLDSVRDCYAVFDVEVPITNSESVWAEVSLRDKHKLFIGSFYRPPTNDSNSQSEQLADLDIILHCLKSKMKNNPNHTLMFGGDFNLGDIEWEKESVCPSSRTKTACEKFVQLLRDHHVSQMQREPTREGRVLGFILY